MILQRHLIKNEPKYQVIWNRNIRELFWIPQYQIKGKFACLYIKKNTIKSYTKNSQRFRKILKKNSVEMFNYKLYAQGGFHPRRCEKIRTQVLRPHRSTQGRYGGTGTVPPPLLYQHLEFHITVKKGVLQSKTEQKKYPV
jgi:hypothetical protein